MFTPLICAQSVDLYEGEAVVAGQGEGERAAALAAAFEDALVRRSGDRSIGEAPEVDAALPQAAEWLQQYRYRQDVETVNGLPQTRTTLIVRFLPQAIDALLAKTKAGVWSEPRAVPVVWLAIDDGKGARLLGNAQAAAVQSLTRRATARGLRLSYPLLDLQEQQAVDASRFWAGDSVAARAASARYQSKAALIGRLYRRGAGWAVEWAIYDGELRLGEVAQSAPSANDLLALGADLAADYLSLRFRQRQSEAGPAGTYVVAIAGIASGEDYARAIGYIEGLSVVQAARVLSATRDRLRLELDLATGVEGLASLVTDDGVLQPGLVANGHAEIVFQLQP